MPPSPPVSTERSLNLSRAAAAQHGLPALLLATVITVTTAAIARGDAPVRGESAFRHGDYVRAFRDLLPLAERGNPKALGLIGFMYEHGFGAPQAYVAAASFYARGAFEGDPFAQAMLGLMYDKGHGVRQDFVLAYKWLNLAAAHTRGHERNAYARFRDAVASKMSKDEIAWGQWLALAWVPLTPPPEGALPELKPPFRP